MKDYLCAIYRSFYSRKLYREVAQNWGAGAVIYLFILLAICWAFMVVRYQPVIDQSFKLMATEIVPQIPEIQIKKGEVITSLNQPYLIKEANGDVIAIVDTGNTYPSLNETSSSTRILLTKHAIFYIDDTNTIRKQEIPNTLTMTVHPQIVKTKLLKFAGWTWVFLFPFLLFLSFIYRLAQSLIYAVIGKIFASYSEISLTYAQILKISLIAVTPAIIFSTVLDWLYVSFSFDLIAFFIITLLYLFFGIKANQQN